MKKNNKANTKRYNKNLKTINQLEDKMKLLDNKELADQTNLLKVRYQEGTDLDTLLPEAFATVREASRRILKKRHFDVQMIGGMVLHDGNITEMKTGEGKTLTELLPAYLNALSGNTVHIVTVNEYLAERDMEEMGKVFKFLGLTVDMIYAGASNARKKKAYQADIVYGTANEFGFDYLRDNTAKRPENITQRNLGFCIVDEVDSVLIDDAKTPLILSAPGQKGTQMYRKVYDVIEPLERAKEPVLYTKMERLTSGTQEIDGDYVVDENNNARLTNQGLLKVEEAFGIKLSEENQIMSNKETLLLHYVRQCIVAKETMKRNAEYIVEDKEVKLIDQSNGRISENRRLSDGLHQAIEAKENVPIKEENETIASITLQKYFMMYDKLAGMTGTAATEREEFKETYLMDVYVVPTNKPMIRQDISDNIFQTLEQKFDAVVEEVKAHQPQPILIGVTTVDQSEKLANHFKEKGINEFSVLNAINHKKEADIIAQAGQSGSLTIATNMAGRGTDIYLGGNPEALALRKLRDEHSYSEETIRLATMPSTDLIPEDKITQVASVRSIYLAYLEAFEKQCAKDKEKVVDLGGLYVIGTERNEARRIDNQLRGRAGRQGDIGKTRFFLSLEDEWLERYDLEKEGRFTEGAILNNLNFDEEKENVTGRDYKRLLKNFNNKQRKLEGDSYESRKNLIEYDEVDDSIRHKFFTMRRKFLLGKDTRELHRRFNEYLEIGVKLIADDILNVNEKQDQAVYTEEQINQIYISLLDSFEIDTPENIQYIRESKSLDKSSRAFQRIVLDAIKEREADIEHFYKHRNQTLADVKYDIVLQSMDDIWRDVLIEMSNTKDACAMSYNGAKQPVELYKERMIEQRKSYKNNLYERIAMTFFKVSYSSRKAIKEREMKEESEKLDRQKEVMVGN